MKGNNNKNKKQNNRHRRAKYIKVKDGDILRDYGNKRYVKFRGKTIEIKDPQQLQDLFNDFNTSNNKK